MTERSPIDTEGDMVVHRNYGIGQIDCIERKTVNGIEVDCFKVTTENGTYWFPVDSLDNPRIHRVASEKRIKSAIKILQSAPEGLEDDPVQWKERIDNVMADGDFLAISGLIRDLSALKTQKKLNRTQEETLNNLKDRFLKEWAASSGVDIKTLQPELRAYLKTSSAKIQNTV